MTLCWACDDGYVEHGRCDECYAPSWTPRRNSSGGVYILQAKCGLVKIGMSRVSLAGRIATLKQQAHGPLKVLAVLPGAGINIERWLHRMFLDIRDIPAAIEEGLPHPTEWFWPSPSMNRLAAGDVFISDGAPWEEREPEPWSPAA